MSLPFYVSHPPIFFTATILNWQQLLLSDSYKDIVVQSLKFISDTKRATVYGFVIMPNHVHIIWNINAPYTLAQVQGSFLRYTAIQIKIDLEKSNNLSLKNYKVNATDRKYQFWERNPLSVPLYSQEVFLQKLNYIHNNPLADKWKLCQYPEEYHYSSARYYHKDGGHDFGLITHYID